MVGRVVKYTIAIGLSLAVGNILGIYLSLPSRVISRQEGEYRVLHVESKNGFSTTLMETEPGNFVVPSEFLRLQKEKGNNFKIKKSLEKTLIKF